MTNQKKLRVLFHSELDGESDSGEIYYRRSGLGDGLRISILVSSFVVWIFLRSVLIVKGVDLEF